MVRARLVRLSWYLRTQRSSDLTIAARNQSSSQFTFQKCSPSPQHRHKYNNREHRHLTKVNRTRPRTTRPIPKTTEEACLPAVSAPSNHSDWATSSNNCSNTNSNSRDLLGRVQRNHLGPRAVAHITRISWWSSRVQGPRSCTSNSNNCLTHRSSMHDGRQPPTNIQMTPIAVKTSTTNKSMPNDSRYI